VTYFLFPGTKQDLKGKHSADVAEIQRQSLVALDSISIKDFRKNVSSSGSGAEIAASSHRGSTLRGLMFQYCTTILNNFSFQSSGNFWVPPLICVCVGVYIAL
jgi:hypothetical protein